MSLRKVTLALSISVALMAHGTPGHAQSGDAAGASEAGPTDPQVVAEASRLYEEGTAAHAAGRYVEAARRFLEADELLPDSAALEAALLAALETDEAVLAMRLVSRTAREPFNEALIDLADRARRRFASRVGRVVVHCEGCEAAVDGEAITPGVASVVAVGAHEVTIVVGGRAERREVVVEPGSIVTLLPVGPTAPEIAPPSPSPVPPPAPSPEDEAPTTSAGLSPAWFWVGLGLTAAAAGGTIASGVDTASKHGAFEDEPSQERADAGQSAQLRTNALIGVTAGLAVVTGVLGLVVVDWGGDDAPGGKGAFAVRLGPTQASFRWRLP